MLAGAAADSGPDQVWMAAPAPALCVRAGGPPAVVDANPAARHWLPTAGVAAGAAADALHCWARAHAARALQRGAAFAAQAPADHAGTAHPAQDDDGAACAAPGLPGLRCVPVVLADGSVLLWLHPAAIEQRVPQTTPAAAQAHAEPAAGLHVLCVEDNPINLQLVCELLALRPQVRLRTAVDGLSGVQAALADRPDLLLLDLQLPDIDGMEVMRRVRASPAMAGCRIVALSADAMPDHIEAALAAGFDDYWTKPIQFEGFLAHIDRLAAAVQP